MPDARARGRDPRNPPLAYGPVPSSPGRGCAGPGGRPPEPRWFQAPRSRAWACSAAALRRDEVDQFLDPAEELRFEVGEAGHRAQDALPRPGGVRRPAEGPQHAFLPGLARGNPRPAADAEHG